MARATSSLPVPVSPSIKTLASVFILAALWGCGNQERKAPDDAKPVSETVSEDVTVSGEAASAAGKTEAVAEKTDAEIAAIEKAAETDLEGHEMVIEEKEAIEKGAPDKAADEKAADVSGAGDAAAMGSGDLASEIMDAEGVKLNSIILAKGVSKREPVEPGTQFTMADGEKIYAILDVNNSTDDVAELFVSWKMPDSDKEIGKTSLNVKSAKKWRTWSFTRWAKKTGKWEAIVRNSDDEIIARAPFEIIE